VGSLNTVLVAGALAVGIGEPFSPPPRAQLGEERSGKFVAINNGPSTVANTSSRTLRFTSVLVAASGSSTAWPCAKSNRSLRLFAKGLRADQLRGSGNAQRQI
jgi:hypothetical protein